MVDHGFKLVRWDSGRQPAQRNLDVTAFCHIVMPETSPMIMSDRGDIISYAHSKSSHELTHASCPACQRLLYCRAGIGTRRPGGRRFDRYWWNGGGGDFFDPRRGGARRRQCDVAGVRHRGGRGALVDLFVCQGPRHPPPRPPCPAFLAEAL